MFSEKRRLTPRAAYGWFHQQSGYIFLLVVFFAFLRAGLHAATPPTLPRASPSSLAAKARAWIPLIGSKNVKHPIPSLMDAADARFRTKLSRQSTTLAAAVSEYKKRHGRPPPLGFDKWYAFAKKYQIVMIDEFDTVVEDLAPFWELSGAEVRRRAALVAALPSIDLVRVRDGEVRTVNLAQGWEDSDNVGGRANGLKDMLAKFVRDLPDMDLPINAMSEGRVVVPWEHKMYPNLTEDAGASAETLLAPGNFTADWAGTGSVWDAWRRTCPPTSPSRRLYDSLGAGWSGTQGGRDRLAEAYHAGVNAASGQTQTVLSVGGGANQGEFVFARRTNAEVDFCSAPAAHHEQGHFFSDWRVLPALVPVFSPARARGFGDIRIPSHYYYGGTRRYTYGWDPVNLEQRTVDAMEVPWEGKRDAVWWRGASTGGGSSPPGFGSGYQRHRFLRMASVGLVSGTAADMRRTTPVTFAVPPQPVLNADTLTGQEIPTYVDAAAYTTVAVPLAQLNAEVMDTAFVKSVVPVGREHRFSDAVELGTAWGYKYLLDLDGMGYSGHFMAYLASDSVPVKATVYDEFFSGWIEPWVHYIPLSAAYAEIYNIVAYFSGPPPAVLRAANLSSAAAPFHGSPHRADPPVLEEPAELTPGDAWESDMPAWKDVRRSVERGAKREVDKVNAPEQEVALVRGAAQEEGDRRLRRIARAGKQWKRTMGRTIDMEVYVYRLALEYARLWADDREAMSYTL
ncbi:capsular associated protein [Mycena metata]|uniref:Capsular associated protein n=1 Tax=Mycena metata TaxID=1033252 RepID=A0AAD7MDQ2_9AGAR|nr:capsular associated protein [Mycena metata]